MLARPHCIAPLNALAPPTAALDVSCIGVLKATRYTQAPDDSPGLLLTSAFSSDAFAISANGQVTRITVKPPHVATSLPLENAAARPATPSPMCRLRAPPAAATAWPSVLVAGQAARDNFPSK